MKRTAHDAYRSALTEVITRVQAQLRDAQPDALPIQMYIAGGAALHILTGERVTEDVDATFSRRVLFSDDIEVSYRDPDGRARIVYLDRTYNDTLGLLHENACKDSKQVDIPGIESNLIDVRILSPLDLAVSKLGRFSDQDRDDVELLAKNGLINATDLRKRAAEALQACVGDTRSVRSSIDIACRIVESLTPKRRTRTGTRK